MKELKLLEDMADAAIADSSYSNRVKVDSILAIAEAFRALEQRAEAAEAKLAELGASVPVYQYESAIYNEENGDTEWYWDDCDKGFYDQYDPSRRRILFTRPAPAISPADLLPDAKAIRKEAGGYAPVYSLQEQQLFIEGATWFRAAILRNIEAGRSLSSGADWFREQYLLKITPTEKHE